jgi:NAD(P)H dehydrogenase (quinone)
VVTGSYDDRDGLRRAFQGARTLLMVSATEHPHRLELHANVVEAAADAGVERVIYTSIFGAGPSCTHTLGRVAAVARDDIADVAVAVLLDNSGGHDGRTHDLTGPEAVTMAEIAEELSRATGRTVTYHAETLEEAYASRASYGAPDWMVAGWVTTYVAIANGEVEGVSGDVEAMALHPPMSLAEFLRRNPDSLQHLRT